jgi:hypothetical protein
MGVDEAGGVGGFIWCIGRGDGGRGGMDKTVAITRNGSRIGITTDSLESPKTERWLFTEEAEVYEAE